jgi:hypothetical protein
MRKYALRLINGKLQLVRKHKHMSAVARMRLLRQHAMRGE